ncbi:hypothetical protein GCM10022276_06300 [Sphingomonas limnosediminicola]|uniref:YdhG-like domain-containing protein n=1 Tax=Sphingomonas limnosediminicola TaxID=940133 RepID=A0ABP7L003_9SPHN
MDDAAAKLGQFLCKYDAPVAADARYALKTLADRFPTATRIVYDNYNALVVGFGASDKVSDAILSIAVYPRYVTLFFLRGARVTDPNGLLEGSGSKVRHIKLKSISLLQTAEVGALIDAAVASAPKPFPLEGKGPLIIKSISPNQRPRRSAP